MSEQPDSDKFSDYALDFLTVKDAGGAVIVPPGPEESEAEFDERIRKIKGEVPE